MNKLRLIVFVFIGLAASLAAVGQTITSFQAGNWDLTTTWIGGVVPTSANSTQINVNHNVTVTSAAFPIGGDLTIDQTTIANAGTASLIIQSGAGVILNNGLGTDLTFSGVGQVNISGQFTANTGTAFTGNTSTNFNFLSGSTYVHGYTAPATGLPTASYNAASTILINGYTGGGTFTAAWNVPVGNVIYNCPTQAAGVVNFAGFLRNIQGNLDIQYTGATGRIYFNQTGTSTVGAGSAITIGGNLSVSTSIAADRQRLFLTTTGTVEVYVAGSFTFGPNSSSANSGSVAGNSGTGTLQVTGNASMTGGNWNFCSGNNGSGIFNLFGNLICNTSTITLTESGGVTSQGNINFIGTSTLQNFDATSATLTNTVNVTVNNPLGVTLASNLLIPGTLNLTNGALSLPGISLTLNGPITQATGSIATSSNPTLIIGGAGAFPGNLTLFGDVFNTFELNRPASNLQTGSNFTVTNLHLYAGTLSNSGSITMSSGGLVDLHALSAANTGVIANAINGTYDVQYTNNVALSSGAELPNISTLLNNLTKLGSSTLTIAKDITINGDLIVTAGTISDGGVVRTINLVGNYTSNGAASNWNKVGTTFNFSGLSVRTLSGATAPTFDILNFTNDVNISVGFQVNGNMSVAANKTVAATVGTCTFGGTTTITNSGTLNLFGVAISGTMTPPAGTIGIASTFNITGTFNATAVGTILFNGNSPLTGASANKTFNNITVGLGSSFTGLVNWTLDGTLDNSGTVSFTGGALTVNGAAVVQNSGSYVFNAITINGTKSLTLNSNFSMSGSLAVNGTGIFASNNTATITGPNTMTGGGTKTFNNLTINSGGGALTPNAIYTINGNLIVDGTLSQGNSTTTFGGTTAISGAGSVTFNNITINASPTSVSSTIPITIRGATFTNAFSFSNSALTTFSIGGTTTLSGVGACSFGAVTINAGTTFTPNQAYSISGNLSIDGILGAGNNLATFNGTTTISTIVGPPTISFNNLLVKGGGTLTAFAGNMTITETVATANGAFKNSGTFNANGGTITFSGATNKTISGSVSTFNNITVNNGAAATDLTFSSNQNIAGVLTLAINAVVSSGGFLTLKSTSERPTADASIAALQGTSSVSGNVTVERYMNIETSNKKRTWRYISSPVQNATIANLQNFIPVNGGPANPFTGESACCFQRGTSMYWYDETQLGLANIGYTPYPTVSNAQTFVTGRGYATYVYGDLLVGSEKYSLTGPINAGLINYNATFTASGGATEDGWNLVGNPFPSTIDWNAAAGWTKTNVGGTIYLLDNSTSVLIYATWNGVTGNNGGSRYIASGQGYYVQASAASPVFTSTESVKVAGQQTNFIRAAALSNLLRVTLSDGTDRDETVIHFRDSATTNFDFKFDARKKKNYIASTNKIYLNLSSITPNNTQLAINSLPSNSASCTNIVPLDVSDIPVGNYNLNFANQTSFDPSSTITLTDNFTATVIDVRQQMNYPFQVTAIAASFGSKRFVLSFAYPQVPAQLNLKTSDVCKGIDASVTVSNSILGIDYSVKLGGYQIGQTVSGTGSDLNFTVPNDSLKLGSNSIQVFAQSQYCPAAYTQSLPIVKQDIFAVGQTSSTSACHAGAVTLSAAGAPSDGHYNWYNNAADIAPIGGESAATFTTPTLQKPKTYYVSIVNVLGCEGSKVPVVANVINYDEASITMLNDLKTLQSNYSTGNQWLDDGQLISGATNQLYVPVKSGNYSVTATSSGCKTTSLPLIYVVAGIESEPDFQSRAFPNPTSGVITVEARLSKETTAQVIDNLGKVVGSVKMFNAHDDIYKGTYDFSNHSAGLYLVRMTDQNEVITIKIIRK